MKTVALENWLRFEEALKLKTGPLWAQGECVPFIRETCPGLLKSSIYKVSEPPVGGNEVDLGLWSLGVLSPVLLFPMT